MQHYSWSVPVIIMAALILCAGCTSAPAAPQAAVTPAPATPALSAYALAPSDLPATWTPVSSREKTAAEMGTAARELGWQDGYVVVYTLPAGNAAGTCTLTQTVTRYSGQNMSSLVPLVIANERKVGGLAFTDLAAPATGPDTRALSAVLVNATPTEISAGGMSPLSFESSAPVATEGYTEVVFGKGDILDVIRMSGTCPSYDTLASLSQTAFIKQG
ncbi:hypothetical protein [Methanoregula sp. UBA64]|jgi:hypothetical protein|uniref:hypothetical protein n=1 Tax=Methanoregula sp. UBA64 TaxID=1915554 RepID=UPI0025E29E0A|nr:hypothetical protein [Methanoregula sp. UBA64]